MSLGQRGERDLASAPEGPLPGARRRDLNKKRIEARVASMPKREGNGIAKLQLRTVAVKAKSAVQRKVIGK